MTDPEITLPSPIKLNLFLHITGVRSDGYHLLQTLFQLLDYGDSLSFKGNNQGKIVRTDLHDFELPQQDLCVRAAQLLREQGNDQDNGVTITLKKTVPPGTGLGAGSSNAATVLIGLNHLWDMRLSGEALLQLGSQLGADVPLFINGHTAWGEGTGELLTSCDQQEQWFCVLLPRAHVSTQKIFCSPQLERNSPRISLEDYASGQTRNTLEAVTVQYYPQVGLALDWLSQFGNARMSGTGASVFLATPSRQEAQSVLSQMPDELDGFVARGCNQSPLHRAMDKICKRR